MGRQSTFTQEIADEICERIGKGEALIRICEDEHLPSDRTVQKWCKEYPEFGSDFADARARGMDAFALQALEIADESSRDKIVDSEGNERTNSEVVARAKLRVETRLKLLACWDPKRYGTQRVEASVETHSPKADQVLSELGSILSKISGQL